MLEQTSFQFCFRSLLSWWFRKECGRIQ